MADEKILIIEDENQIAEVVKSYLLREGFTVTLADTGQKALSLIKKGYDLIILDLMLPDMAGETICSSIREFSDIPIIMLTAKNTEDERVRGLGLGADDYVTKPFSPRELVARVKALLRRIQKKEGQGLSFNKGLLQIDPLAMEVRKGGKSLSFTTTEFKILYFLAKRPEVVINRFQIVQSVLGYDFEGYDRVIDAHIKNIRHKIEEDPHSPLFIKTVYGAGYKFIGKPDTS